MNKKEFETTLGGRVLKVEIGEVAKQANGAAMIHYGDSTDVQVGS